MFYFAVSLAIGWAVARNGNAIGLAIAIAIASESMLDFTVSLAIGLAVGDAIGLAMRTLRGYIQVTFDERRDGRLRCFVNGVIYKAWYMVYVGFKVANIMGNLVSKSLLMAVVSHAFHMCLVDCPDFLLWAADPLRQVIGIVADGAINWINTYAAEPENAIYWGPAAVGFLLMIEAIYPPHLYGPQTDTDTDTDVVRFDFSSDSSYED